MRALRPCGPPGECRCGAPAHATLEGLCARGHALPGNTRALVSGARSSQFWAAAEAVRREIAAAAVSDAGHTPEDAPRALAAAADGLAQSVLLRDACFERVVESGGPLSADGRTRRALTAWLQAADRCERYLRLLGLRRVPKAADDDYLARYRPARQDET